MSVHIGQDRHVVFGLAEIAETGKQVEDAVKLLSE